MTGFSTKTTGTGSNTTASDLPKITNEQWQEWNEYEWEQLKATPVKVGDKETKTVTAIGYLNFIMQLGNQPQPPTQLSSNLPHPKQGEEYSPEEIARMKSHPTNSFHWVEEYEKGEKVTKRVVQWDSQPEEELILAVDFPSVQINYTKHPSFTGEKVEDTTPMRIDFNGKWKRGLNKRISNELHWKTKDLRPSAIQYKIAAAVGVLDTYKEDQHDLAHLAGVCCNWDIVMTKNVKGDATFYKTEIKDPSPIQDIAGRTPYTVAEQLEDNPNTSDFCGILFDADVDSYTKEQLEQVRFLWWQQCAKAFKFDKNKGTKRDGEWIKEGSLDWVDSALYKAAVKLGIDLPKVGGYDNSSSPSEEGEETPSKVVEPAKKVEPKPTPKPIESNNEPDFDDDIPF